MASPVSADDVRHVAALARLGLDDGQVRELTRELNTILEHMEVLNRVDTSGVGELGSLSDEMRLRSDQGPPIPLDEPPESFGPQMRDGFFIVPRLASHEDSE
jgi:aspartyl-tRNA(Asn)/glutamyl-tRNA(Gln) amidotransferase subunit C